MDLSGPVQISLVSCAKGNMKNYKPVSIWTMFCLIVGATTSQAAVENNISTTVSPSPDAQIQHLLNRLSFGPRPGDVERVKQMGIQRYVDSQLNPGSTPEAREVQSYLSSNQTLSMSPAELFGTYGRPAIEEALGNRGNKDPELKKQASKMQHDNYAKVIGEASGEHLVRALYSPKQLQEVMTDFWFNHFNISKDKGLDHLWVGNFEDQAIRPNALGNFRTLLGATCHHPAMLFYLDNWQNSAPGSKQLAQGRRLNPNKPQNSKANKPGINENYARELMELHTLGVDGGYTQDDVIALAHVLTGLGLPARRGSAFDSDSSNAGYRFYPGRHDFGTKNFLGIQIPGSGEGEIEYALDVLAKAPQTAHHISYQLAQYFISDNPPEAAVKACTETFQASNGDIKAVLRTLFSRPEFWDAKNIQAKFKSPQRFVLSTLRASEIQPTNYLPILGFLRQTGQPLYGCLTPDGYKNTKEAWLNPDGLLRRISLATAIGSGRMPGAQGIEVDPKRLLDAVGKELQPATIAQLEKTPQKLKAAVVLGSPEFMKY